MTQRAFVPAAGHDHWLRFYDPLTRLLGAPAALRKLVDLADLRAAQRVLDIGCGTGTLAIMVKQRFPQVDITALDPDQGALDRARRKAERARVDIDFVRGFADSLPCPDASFDRVLSSFMLHHLTHDEQQATLADVFRALKAGGSLHILDFAGHDRPRGMIARLLHRDEHVHDSAEGRLVAMLHSAGFSASAALGAGRTLLGPIDFHRAER